MRPLFYALGSNRFQEQIANELGRRVTPGRSGRPRKQAMSESLDLFSSRGGLIVVCPLFFPKNHAFCCRIKRKDFNTEDT